MATITIIIATTNTDDSGNHQRIGGSNCLYHFCSDGNGGLHHIGGNGNHQIGNDNNNDDR